MNLSLQVLFELRLVVIEVRDLRPKIDECFFILEQMPSQFYLLWFIFNLIQVFLFEFDFSSFPLVLCEFFEFIICSSLVHALDSLSEF
jgi:hypothetical protein